MWHVTFDPTTNIPSALTGAITIGVHYFEDSNIRLDNSSRQNISLGNTVIKGREGGRRRVNGRMKEE